MMKRHRPVELILPLIAVVLAGLLTLSYANLLGYPTEAITSWAPYYSSAFLSPADRALYELMIYTN